jgi:hypothetical protein
MAGATGRTSAQPDDCLEDNGAERGHAMAFSLSAPLCPFKLIVGSIIAKISINFAGVASKAP